MCVGICVCVWGGVSVCIGISVCGYQCTWCGYKSVGTSVFVSVCV